MIDIDNILGRSDYTASHFYQDVSSNHLIKICIAKSLYILKIYKSRKCFERELNFMYLFNKHNCKVPKLVKFGSFGTELWILYEYVRGISLNQIEGQLSKNTWKQIGRELRKIHSISVLDETDMERKKSEFLNRIEKRFMSFNDNTIDNSLLLDAFLFLTNNFFHIKKSSFGIILYDFNERHIIVTQKKDKWIFEAFIDFEQTCFGSIYVDIAALYISTLLDNIEFEKGFWSGHGTSEFLFENLCINFFIIYFGLELSTVLRAVNTHHYHFGLSIIEKALIRISS